MTNTSIRRQSTLLLFTFALTSPFWAAAQSTVGGSTGTDPCPPKVHCTSVAPVSTSSGGTTDSTSAPAGTSSLAGAVGQALLALLGLG